MRRRFTSAKEKRTYSNIFNVTIRCTVDEYDENDGLRIFNDDFELSQVRFIRVNLGDGEYKELDISHVVALSSGEYDFEIGLGLFYNAFNMFQDVNLLFCDMSDVDLSLLTIASGMFRNTFIENTPFEELPATTLARDCYAGMFEGCTLLTTAPELPATTLARGCYAGMFEGCTSLTIAPVLPATTLVGICYHSMFRGCTKLNYIKMLATNIPADFCLYNWVGDVSPTGTFVKSKDATWDVVGDSGVPTGWTVIDDTFPTNEDGFPESTEFSFPLYLNFPKEPSYEDEYEVEYTLEGEIIESLEQWIQNQGVDGLDYVPETTVKANPIFINGYRVTDIKRYPTAFKGINEFDSVELMAGSIIAVKSK